MNEPRATSMVPAGAAPGQMVALVCRDVGYPSDSAAVTFRQGGTARDGFLFRPPTSADTLFVRIPRELMPGPCQVYVNMGGESAAVPASLACDLSAVPAAPVLRGIYAHPRSEQCLEAVRTGDTVLVSGYGIDTCCWTVVFAQDGLIHEGVYLTTLSNNVVKIAPTVSVPLSLHNGVAEVSVSVSRMNAGVPRSAPSAPLRVTVLAPNPAGTEVGRAGWGMLKGLIIRGAGTARGERR